MIKDITRTIGLDTLTFPADPRILIEPAYSIERGDGWNLFRMEMSNHTGTHLDSPLHKFKKGKNLNDFKMEDFISDCIVIEIKSKVSVTVKEIENKKIFKGQAVLFKTNNSKLQRKKISEKFIYIEQETAEFLKDKEVKLVGLDYLSVDAFDSVSFPVHDILLKNNILILEDVDLRKIKPGKFKLYCFPIKLHKSNGAPCRAFLI
jgi:arylformamidase